jgi:hypothetical protein
MLRVSSSILSEMTREDEVQRAVYAFNCKPRHGIAELCRLYETSESPASIAHLLHVVPGLLGEQIGEFLSRRENGAILTAYFQELGLDHPFLDALRHALGSRLQLPTEAEQIDHVVEAWARCWARRHDRCGDHIYILAFACVLLNSDLHHPNVARRMTVADFIGNVRGAVTADAIDDVTLTEIYNSIRTRPFQVKRTNGDDFLALSCPKLRGTLGKRRESIFSVWTAHYFVLTDSACLYYFADSSPASAEAGPLGMIQLIDVDIRRVKSTKIQIVSTVRDIQYIKFERKKPELVRGVAQIMLRAASLKRRERWFYRLKTSYVFLRCAGDTSTAQIPGDLTMIPQATSTSLGDLDAEHETSPKGSDSEDVPAV